MKEGRCADVCGQFFSRTCSAFQCFGSKKRPPDKENTLFSTSSTDGYSASSHGSASVSHVLGNNSALTFTMVEITKATCNFSPSFKIGQGGFGVVYKGRLANGIDVAIKRARKDTFEKHMTAQFHSEVQLLASIEHLNLVKLIGYLEEKNERILVEEYVPNGNLRQHLDCEFGVVLDLPLRLDIAIDIAHALTYLHLYADRPIIHRDVKATNILLTDNFRAKVCDFGFSRVGPVGLDSTHVSTQVKGTAGYLDPEYLKSYQLTQKSDVYSFGILLVELMTGRRPIEQSRGVQERITVRWAFAKYLDGNTVELLDPRLERNGPNQQVMERMAELAFQCSAPTRNDRPSMKKAAEYLWTIRKDFRDSNQGQQPYSARRRSSGQMNR